jgi:uroporphyrin-III C-methyltransferase
LLASSSEAGAAQLALAIETDARRGSDAPRLGQVTLVGAGPGDPGLITVAGRKALMSADVVLHDSLVSTATLSLCGRAARTIDVGKRAGMPSTAQGDITAMLIAEARAGHNVVRLKGGDPFLFGRGGEEVAALGDAGIPVRVIPGVSSALAAPAAAGIPVTYRDVAASVAFVTGRRAAAADNEALEALARAADTLVVVMPGNLDSLAHRLASVLGPQRPAALVSSATTAAQSVVRAPIGRLAAVARSAALAAPVTLIVGDVVDVLSTVASARSQPGTTYSAAVAAVAGEVVHAATPRQTIGGSR